EGGDPGAVHLGHQPARVEAGVVVQENGRLGVPRGEEVGPGVLGPAGRRDVQVHVAGPQPDPVHGGQVPDGVRGVGVLDQLGAGGGAGGEVQHQRVVGEGRPVGGVVHGRAVGVLVGQPGGARARSDRDAGVVARHLVELGGVGGGGDDVPDAAPVDAVAQVGGAEQRGGRDDHGAQL